MTPTPFESVAHHLERSEVEALKRENSSLRSRLEEMTKERDEARCWIETARHYANGAEYYRGLVDQIGEMLGPGAKTADDGELGPEVLRAKVPEVVAATLSSLKAKLERARGVVQKAHDLGLNRPHDGSQLDEDLEELILLTSEFLSSTNPESEEYLEATHEGLKCPQGESAVGTAQTQGAVADARQEGGADGRQRAPGAGTGEQAGREPSPMPERCPRCDGCGRIADSDDGEPWTVWEELPPGSDIAVRIGAVKPIPCPRCSPVASPESGESSRGSSGGEG